MNNIVNELEEKNLENITKRKTKDHLSVSTQLGKAGEHLVCADLILQGYNSFLADQGLPYDVLVDVNGKIYRMQVKSTRGPKDITRFTEKREVYRYNLVSGKNRNKMPAVENTDYFAFVDLKDKKIAYLSTSEMINKSTGKIRQGIDFKSKNIEYKGSHSDRGAKYFEDYDKFRTNK